MMLNYLCVPSSSEGIAGFEKIIEFSYFSVSVTANYFVETIKHDRIRAVIYKLNQMARDYFVKQEELCKLSKTDKILAMWSNSPDPICHLFPVLINFCHLCLTAFIFLHEKKLQNSFSECLD